jgi:hypothetical protein
MSRRLGVVVLALGILVASMALKTAMIGSNSSGTAIMANGAAPVPPPPPPPPAKSA